MKYLLLVLVPILIIAVILLLTHNSPPSPKNLITALPSSAPQIVSCPPGFIKVPGNPLYHTSDFCVMKYDAKCALLAQPEVGLAPALGNPCLGAAAGHSYNTYKNNGPGCFCTNDRQIISTSSGYPVAYVPMIKSDHRDTRNLCSSRGWHLITNPEWMTIARNVETVSANWCNPDGTDCGYPPGTPGKILANGYYKSPYDQALTAGPDNLPCFGTTTDGSDVCGGKNSQKRTLTLTNNEIVWDFAGNVWSWVDALVQRKDEPKSRTAGKLDYGWIVRSEFAPGGLIPSTLIDNGQGPSMGYDAFRPSNPDWNSRQGVGRIYHWSSQTDSDTTEYAFIRGGNWKHGMDDGAFTIHLSPVPGKENINDVSFRCVTVPQITP